MSAPPNEQLYVGVELSASVARAALVNTAGEVLARRESALAAVDLAPQVARLVTELRDSAPAGVAGLGLGVPGLVNPQTGRVVISTDIPSVVREDLRASLAQSSGLPVALDNDANAGALGEYAAGAGRGSRNMFYVTTAQASAARSSSRAACGAGRRVSPGSSGTSPSTPKASSARAATSAALRRWRRPRTSSAARTSV
jgi:hypothetical protein